MPADCTEGAKVTKILLVDDDPDFVLLGRSILESQGYQVLEASDGQEALEKMRLDEPDLVLLDVMMSTTLEGVQVSREMESDPKLADVPIVMISSIATTEYAAEFPDDERIPIAAWISKPIQPAVLLKTIEGLLADTPHLLAEPEEGMSNGC
jgi:CheY-like chemotaxis protein